MTFFGNSGDDKSKRRVTFGDLFNPRFGNDIRPMGEAVKMFVHLIAYIFATNGMFPRNHPALSNDPSVRLTMADVLRTAWQHVEFTREGLTKTVIFFAVAGTLAFTALFILFAVLSLFVGKAHAQSMFIPPDTSKDWGWGWINYIFLGQAMPSTISNVSTLCDWQKALGTGLGYYSAGMLVLAGVILLYQLMKMVAETAHTGKPMGSANQIWAPIRLVVAIGLLVPIGSTVSAGSSCGAGASVVTGLNSGQYIVVHMARWGSGLASNIWKKFVDGLEDRGDPEACSSTPTGPASPSCIRIPEAQIKAFTHGILTNIACLAFYNYHTSKMELPASELLSFNKLSDGTYYFGRDASGYQKLCGGFKPINVPANKTLYENVYKVQMDHITSIYLPVLRSLVENHALDFVENDDLNNRQSSKDVDDVMKAFQTTVSSLVQTELDNVDKTLKNEKDANTSYTDYGWLAAGAWFNTLARIVTNRADAVEGALPEIIKPDIYTEAKRDEYTYFEVGSPPLTTPAHDGGPKDPVSATVRDLNEFRDWLGDLGKTEAQLKAAATAGLAPGTGGSGFINGLLGVVDYAASASGVWNSNSGQLAIKFDKTRNPLAEVAQLGQNLIQMSFTLFMAAGAAYGVASLLAVFAPLSGIGGALGTLGNLGGSLLGFLAGIMMTGGILLGYFLPLVPFIRFFFATMTWIIGVAEALVAAPLLALAHLNPEGAGLPGQQGRQGYYFIVNVFLRPALMIFGLILGYLLFMVGIAFLNTMFIYAAYGTGTMTGELPVFAKIVYTFMYCAFAYVLGQNSFKSIGLFSQTALQWLGGGSAHIEKMGDHHTVVGAMTGVGGYLAGQHMLQALQAPGKAAEGASAARGKAVAGRQHGELLNALSGTGGSGGQVQGGGGGQVQGSGNAQQLPQGYSQPQGSPIIQPTGTNQTAGPRPGSKQTY